jgi:hypothetical protein
VVGLLEHDDGHCRAAGGAIYRLPQWFDAINRALVCLAAEPDVPRLDRRPYDLPDHDAPRHRHLAVLGGALFSAAHACESALTESPQVEGEAELLLPAGIALKITGVLPKDASGLTIITCEDDDDAPTLIS